MNTHVSVDLMPFFFSSIHDPLLCSPSRVVRGMFASVSQIVFVEDGVAGAFLLAGLAVYSRISAGAALAGAAIGTLTAVALGRNLS